MKRWLLFPVMLVLCMLLGGCAVQQTKQLSPESLQFSFANPAVLTVGEQTYSCVVWHDLTQKTRISFTEEGALQSFSFEKTPEKLTVSYGELTYPVRSAGFPEDSPLCLLAGLLDYSQSYTNLTPAGGTQFTGEYQGQSFMLTANADGSLRQLSMERGVTVEFLPEPDGSNETASF